MLQTLFCIIRNNWQLKAVAAQMNLHYNTVKYRYHKIKEILGTDTDLSSVRISLTLAMELYILNNSGKEKNS
jgi:purine catabolism regulator